MTHTYKISGMTCEGCAAKIKHLLSNISGVTNVLIHLAKQDGDITMEHHIPISELKKALSGTKYKIEEEQHSIETIPSDLSPVTLKTYKPIFLIFGFITGITLLIQFINPPFNLMQFMQQFMAGFFLVFSFFKLLDVAAFAMSYRNYDIIAKTWNGYGYVYPFIELALGISFLIPSLILLSNVATLIIMVVSSIGVIQSVVKKQKIQCACLGAVFNLPMSTITIIEDGLMVTMSAISLILLKH